MSLELYIELIIADCRMCERGGIISNPPYPRMMIPIFQSNLLSGRIYKKDSHLFNLISVDFFEQQSIGCDNRSSNVGALRAIHHFLQL